MTSQKPETIFDFGGFDKKLYSMKYPAKGDLELSMKIKALLDEAKIKNFEDKNVGFDHGTWIPLKVMYPNADIPVVVVSTLPDDSVTNIRVGKAIQSLRDEGVLIFGSGHVVHNLRAMFADWGNPDATEKKWSKDFNAAVCKAIETPAKDMIKTIEKWKDLEGAAMSVPTDDHFAALCVSVGAVDSDNEIRGKVVFSAHTIAKFPQNVFIFN